MAGDETAGVSVNGGETAGRCDGKQAAAHGVSLQTKQLEELLHAGIMAQLEEIVAQQELTLWRRGQEEIAQLHQDRLTAQSTLQELQKQEEALIQEQAEMSRALLDITSKLDFVANEMTEAVRAHTAASTVPAPAPAEQGGKTPEAAPSSASYEDYQVDCADGLHASLPPLLLSSASPMVSTVSSDSSAAGAVAANAVCVAAQAAAAAAAAAAAVGLPPESAAAAAAVAALEQNAEGPRTPQRALRPGSEFFPEGVAQGYLPNQYQNSPAILSLASVLPSQQTPPPPGPPPGPPSRLNIAACLDAEASCKPVAAPPQLRAEAPAFVPGAATAEAR